jgi:hypothetical protein
VCTVTWFGSRDGYFLYANRDELRTRPPASPPTRHHKAGTRYLAPTDGAAGGTWIAVNEFGLSLCLLNDYSATARIARGDFVSRGHLVADLIRAHELDDLARLWSNCELPSYRPFKLLALSPGQQARLLGWNGEASSLTSDGVVPPLCSSSFDEAGATRARAELFSDTALDDDGDRRKGHLRFHQSHRPERGPYSVCMHRPDAVTVSFTIVETNPAQISMVYADGAPCSTPLEHLATLDRAS